VQTYQFYCKRLRISSIFQGAIAIALFFALLFFFYNLVTPRLCLTQCSGDSSLKLRSVYNRFAQNIISEKPLLGVGPGNFVSYLELHNNQGLTNWQLHPTHNIYLLISSEVGLFGLVSFLIIIFVVFLRSGLRLDNLFQNPFAILFFLMLFIGLVDHYFWTLPQGQMMFWLLLAFFEVSVRMKRTNKISTQKVFSQ
jgi:O-antigen ligase